MVMLVIWDTIAPIMTSFEWKEALDGESSICRLDQYIIAPNDKYIWD